MTARYRQDYRVTAHIVSPKLDVLRFDVRADTIADARRFAADELRRSRPGVRFSLVAVPVCALCRRPIFAGDDIKIHHDGSTQHWTCAAVRHRERDDFDDLDDLSDVPF